jgi:aminoglycoside phosphotransferase
LTDKTKNKKPGTPNVKTMLNRALGLLMLLLKRLKDGSHKSCPFSMKTARTIHIIPKYDINKITKLSFHGLPRK